MSCKNECKKLIKYVRTNSKVLQDKGCHCCGPKRFHAMQTHNFNIVVCCNCDEGTFLEVN